MIIIGEKINATRKAIAAALTERNEKVIIQTAVEQAAAGAEYIDVNAGDPREGMEEKNMAWMVDLVQANTDKALAIDSADVAAMRKGLSLAKRKPILNSISLEKDRLGPMLPIVAEHDCMVVALLMSDAGTPCMVDDRMQRAELLIKQLTGAGKSLSDIIIDPCFLPVSADMNAGRNVVDAIGKIHAAWPEVHIGGGCSNISFGLPKRRLINLALLTQAIYHGMDTGLVDPCAEGVMATILAAEAVAGRDDFCMNYVMTMK